MKKQKSQLSEILRYLQTHKRGITRAQAWDLFGCQNLPDIIYKLRRRGYEIQARQITKKNRYGHASTFFQYYMPV